jgi:SAM-dependent methyltransferase
MGMTEGTRLHLGCGRTILADWINLDMVKLDGVDVVADLDDCRKTPLPFADGQIGEFLGNHVLEHIRDPLALMAELYRIARPDARAVFRVPYGASDDAFEDPTHVRQYFVNSFMYFSQPAYSRADYGYRGDWATERVILTVEAARFKDRSPAEIMGAVNSLRNVVREMAVELRAVKPAREPKLELLARPRVEIRRV